MKRLKTSVDKFIENSLKSIKLKMEIEERVADYADYLTVLSESRSANKKQKHYRALNRIELHPTVSLNNSIARDDIKKAEIFADFFQSVFISSTDPIFNDSIPVPIITGFSIEESRITNILENMYVSKATGYSEIVSSTWTLSTQLKLEKSLQPRLSSL